MVRTRIKQVAAVAKQSGDFGIDIVAPLAQQDLTGITATPASLPGLIDIPLTVPVEAIGGLPAEPDEDVLSLGEEIIGLETPDLELQATRTPEDQPGIVEPEAATGLQQRLDPKAGIVAGRAPRRSPPSSTSTRPV